MPSTPDDHLMLPVDLLRAGLFIQLDLGWMDHPFPRGRFRLEGTDEIDTLRRLGVREVRVQRSASDPQALASAQLDLAIQAERAETSLSPAVSKAVSPAAPPAADPPAGALGSTAQRQRRALLQAQRDSLAHSERVHAQITRGWQGVMRDAVSQPMQAAQAAAALAHGLCDELSGDPETAIRVIGEAAGTAQSQHAMNVTVLSLLLGRSLGLEGPALQELAMGALLHDVGKLMLPDHLRNADASNPALQLRERREHVAQGVRLGMAMGLDANVLRVIGQHHEWHDGSGLPQGLAGPAIALAARVVALVNRYDRLCNPPPGEPLRTPHEAQAHLFAHQRAQLDPTVLAAFIKLLGVYPPGSIVQLSDERMALVIAVHPARPLRPSVRVHDPRLAADETPLLHLDAHPEIGIRRSLHPQHLPRAVVEALSVRGRIHYYFAHDLEPASVRPAEFA
ncbi:HD-GYP domain-containing protein [Leptothrix sp. BB-4]